jgi:hypothetical protein
VAFKFFKASKDFKPRFHLPKPHALRATPTANAIAADHSARRVMEAGGDSRVGDDGWGGGAGVQLAASISPGSRRRYHPFGVHQAAKKPVLDDLQDPLERSASRAIVAIALASVIDKSPEVIRDFPVLVAHK